LDEDGKVVGEVQYSKPVQEGPDGDYSISTTLVMKPESKPPTVLRLRFCVEQWGAPAKVGDPAPFYKFDLLYHPNEGRPTCKLGICDGIPGGRGAAETHMNGLHADGRFEAYLNREDVQVMGTVERLLAFCESTRIR
jgi:hypothetical protein